LRYQFLLLASLVLIIPVILSLVGNLLYLNRLCQVADTAPRFENSSADLAAIASSPTSPLPPFPALAVIIPAYDEATNIQDCVETVFASLNGELDTCRSPMVAPIWVVDD
jgi:cellulose synthase/poly-beta-1,6-N-acetylglucosamine synthase-like glycosyltransferase